MQSKTVKRVKFLSRLLTSVVLLSAFGLTIDMGQLAKLIVHTKAGFILLAFITLIINRLPVYYRIKLLLGAKDIYVRYTDIARISWMCDFGNLFMPGFVAVQRKVDRLGVEVKRWFWV